MASGMGAAADVPKNGLPKSSHARDRYAVGGRDIRFDQELASRG